MKIRLILIAADFAPVGCHHIKFLSEEGAVLIHATKVDGAAGGEFNSFSTDDGRYASDVPLSEWEALEAKVRRADYLVNLPDADVAEAAWRYLGPEAASRYCAGDRLATDEAGHEAIARLAAQVREERLAE